jgi:polyisoprenoid-binding protein YceI
MTTATDSIPAGTTGPPLRDGVWTVDPQRSEIGFAVKEMWGLRTVRGVFRTFDGRLTVAAGRAAGELTIDAAGLDTGNDRRDRHLRSPAFFDAERHPQVVFTATAVTAHDGALTVTGDLAIGSSRARLEIAVDVEQEAGGALRLEGGTTVSRAAAGLDWNMLGMIRGDALLRARLTLTRAAGL